MKLSSILETLRHQHGEPARRGRFGWWPANSIFELIVGAVLTQNTAWVNVEHAIKNLKQAKVLDAQAILRLSPAQLAQLIRPSGYYNVKEKRLRAISHWYAEHGPKRRLEKHSTEHLRRELLAVHGVGPETADDILLYAFNRPVFVVDAYTRRLFSRLGLADARISYDALQQLFERELPPDATGYGEFHALIVWHGKRICKKRPRCEHCQLQTKCAYFASSTL